MNVLGTDEHLCCYALIGYALIGLEGSMPTQQR
jgi:hypothetical protein